MNNFRFCVRTFFLSPNCSPNAENVLVLVGGPALQDGYKFLDFDTVERVIDFDSTLLIVSEFFVELNIIFILETAGVLV